MNINHASRWLRLQAVDGDMRPTESHLSAEESAATLAKQLADADHLDLALIVLTAALTSGSFAEKVELAPAYLSYLVTPGLLSEEQDFEAARVLIVGVLRETYMGGLSPLPDLCYPFVHCLLDRDLLDGAVDLMAEMHPQPWDNEPDHGKYATVMERIVRAETLSVELGEKLLDALGRAFLPLGSMLVEELEGRLSVLKSMRAIEERESRSRRELTERHVPLGNSVFAPPIHGPLLPACVEELVGSSQDLEHLRLLGWPLVDYLINRNRLDEAVKLMAEMHPHPWDKEADHGKYATVMERIISAETFSIELGETVLEALGRAFLPLGSMLVEELEGRLSVLKGLRALEESHSRRKLT